ncbi:MAG: nucleoside transporter C-terminal domain-containing protein [Planctomycetota bacterium]
MGYLRACLGIAFFCLVAWLLSSHRRRFPWRIVVVSLAMQVVLGWLVLETRSGQRVVQGIADFVTRLIGMTADGTRLVFGGLSQADFGAGGWGYPFAFAATGLPVILFFSALMAVLYHFGIMQVVIWAMARVMTWLMGVSGAESMAIAANVFVGQTEAPLVVRPYIPRLTRSELNALMTGGFATIAGSVLAVYMGLLGAELGPHLLAASVMSAPAAFLMAKIIVPETERAETAGRVELSIERTAGNVIEAAANGTSDGLKLWLNVIAMLIAFLGLVALVNWPLGWLGAEVAGIPDDLSLGRIFGWVFAPVAWLMGVEGWHDCQLFGSLLGTKVAVNEFVAYEGLSRMLPLPVADLLGAAWGAELRFAGLGGGDGGAAGLAIGALLAPGVEHALAAAPESARGLAAHLHGERAAAMAAYALCGFANFASIGIQIGGISPLAPERKPLISQLALKAMLGGAFASWMTATVAGMFLR